MSISTQEPAAITRWCADARSHQQAGRLDQARDLYCQVIEHDPAHTEAYHQLSLLLYRARQHALALTLIQRAIQLDPTRPDLVNTLGAICLALGDTLAAEAFFLQALKMRPGDGNALCNLAAVRVDQGRPAEAVPLLEQVLAAQPHHVVSLFNLANALLDLGQTEEAICRYRQIVQLAPGHVDAQLNLGMALWMQGNHSEGRAACQQVLDRIPDDALRLRLALMVPALPASWEEIHAQRTALVAEITRLRNTPFSLPDPVRSGDPAAFYLAYQGLNDRALRQDLAQLYLTATNGLDAVAPHCVEPRPHRRIRVGFVSSFLHHHTIGKLTAGLIRELDRQQFEVVLFPFQRREDDLARMIRASADRTVPLPLSLAAARILVAEQELDVLYYPDIGMDPFTYFLGYARLARVQCVSWGHPVTTGIPNIDYFVSSTHLEPEGAQEHYSEQLVCLERLPVYYDRPQLHGPPLDRASLGLPEHGPIYLCPQSLFKLHPDFDAVLAQLLQADRHGHIVLMGDPQAALARTLRERWQRHIGPEAQRIRFLARLNEAAFLRLVAEARVLLDTFPFGGGNTTYEALGLGTPIVTLPGKYMRGRVTLGCYRQMGYEDCVARDVEEYVALAVRLGNDAAYRQDVSEHIRASSAALFADTQAVRLLERFFLHALQSARRP